MLSLRDPAVRTTQGARMRHGQKRQQLHVVVISFIRGQYIFWMKHVALLRDLPCQLCGKGTSAPSRHCKLVPNFRLVRQPGQGHWGNCLEAQGAPKTRLNLGQTRCTGKQLV